MSRRAPREPRSLPPRDARSSDDPSAELPPIDPKWLRTDVACEPGWIYFIDAAGDVARFALNGLRVGRPQKVARLGIEREDGFLYYVDADGDVARVRSAH